jgi:uncharacterized protein YceH (UPF0502 family)
MAPLGSLEHVDQVLGTLSDRGYVRSLGRRPGQKEDRYEHLFGGDTAPAAPATPVAPAAPAPHHECVPTVDPAPAAPPDPAHDGDLSARVAALEDEVAALRADLDALRQVGSASPTR